MNFDLEQAIQTIITNQYFLKLKNVVENSSYHNHEPVYSHLLKTCGIAKREIQGDFITNQEAKKAFLDFVNQPVSGIERKDLMILIALLHDIGKVLVYEENGATKQLIFTFLDGHTVCPGHEYWGSTILETFVKDLHLPQEVTTYMQNIIRQHDTFSENYFLTRKDWDIETIIVDSKARGEGKYIELFFNIYCDCFTAAPFEPAKEKIIQILNSPSFYSKRTYKLP